MRGPHRRGAALSQLPQQLSRGDDQDDLLHRYEITKRIITARGLEHLAARIPGETPDGSAVERRLRCRRCDWKRQAKKAEAPEVSIPLVEAGS